MPGFNICATGDGPSATNEMRRKHRWIFETLGKGGSTFFSETSLLYLKTAQRPHPKFEEVVMHHNQEQAKFAGKTSWEPLKLTWYDSENPDSSKEIYEWFQAISDFTTANVNPPSEYKREGVLAMLNGMGVPTQRWKICNSWPQDGNWDDLDYTDSEICTIEVQVLYDRAYQIGV